MRSIASLAPIAVLTAAALLAVLPPRARAEEGDLTVRVTTLEAETKALRAEVAYLLAREEAATRAAGALAVAAADLSNATSQARAAGFEAAAVPAASRQAVLRGLDVLGGHLKAAVPPATREQETLRRAAADARKAVGG